MMAMSSERYQNIIIALEAQTARADAIVSLLLADHIFEAAAEADAYATDYFPSAAQAADTENGG